MKILFALGLFAAAAFSQSAFFVTVSPPQPFGLVDVGASATQTVVVNATNTTAVDMTVTVEGSTSFLVSPSTFTLAPSGLQVLTVTFTPSTSPAFQRGRLKVSSGNTYASVELVGKANPYGAATTRLVCVLDATTHTVVMLDGLQQCFSVPLAVDQAYQSYMLDSMDRSGNDFVYRYANVWDYITKFFIVDVLSKLDQYPPADVAAAKDQAQQKLLAVDAAKAAILQGAQPQ